MQILEDDDTRTRQDGEFIALSRGFDTRLTAWAAGQLDLADSIRAHTRHGRTPRRPALSIGEASAHLLLFTFRADSDPSPIHLLVARDGLLIVADGDDLDRIRDRLHAPSTSPSPDLWAIVIDLVHQLALHTQDVLDDMVERSRRLEVRAAGFTSAPERKAIAELRNHLFSIQEISDTQHRLMAPDGDLAQCLSPGHRRQLRRSANAVDAVRSRATQQYARLGDVLQQQGTIISERLTFVATIFLPLNLAAGFFGTNFGWLVDRIGSLSAFLALGVALPLLLVLVTIVLTHRVARSS